MQKLPLVNTTDHTYRSYFVNYFITQNSCLPSSLEFRILYNASDFFKKLKDIVDYKFNSSNTVYKNGKRIVENKDSFLIVENNIFIQLEHPSHDTPQYTWFKPRKNREEVNIETILIYFCEKSNQEIIEKIRCFILSLTPLKEETKNLINIVIQEHHGLELKEFQIKKPKLDLAYNYNDDLLPIHQIIIKAINRKNADGLVLLHGDPGTGKTNYIKFLISKIRKKVIYLPPNLATEISSPSFINFLADHQDTVLVIEDGENILKNRESGENQGVSNLLNISNGLLSDILKIQIIATFNCDIKEIDPALLRQGRLIAKYKFDKLSVEKSQRLSDKLGFKNTINKEMGVAEIYNQDKRDFRDKKTSIGFKIGNL